MENIIFKCIKKIEFYLKVELNIVTKIYIKIQKQYNKIHYFLLMLLRFNF